MIYQTTILATFILAVLLLTVSKKYFLLPFILAACFIPADQRVLIFDLDFTPLRILVVIGFLRIAFRVEQLTFKWNNFDKLVIAWGVCGAIIYVIQWSNMRALIFKCGVLFDIIGLYWLSRLNIHSWNDIKITIRILAVCSIFLAVLVGLEWITGRNPFMIMGRVGTVIRYSRYRCQASFPHSIMLGLFWATIFPLFIGLARTENRKILYWFAAAASIFMVAATSSSTPYLTLFMIIVILCGYKWRQYTRFAIYIIATALMLLHVIMSGPVWSLIAQVSVVQGSTGMHRYLIVNEAINHLGEWVLLGSRSTAHWGHGLQDLTNQYIIEGVQGGLATLIIFLTMLYTALRFLLRLTFTSGQHQQRFLAWCIFVAIAGNCIAFFGISYFGQMIMLWYLMLAWVAFLSNSTQFRKDKKVYYAIPDSNRQDIKKV
ncbi:hypothetical protein ACFLZ8_02685 [Planctomycetota bacterium]